MDIVTQVQILHEVCLLFVYKIYGRPNRIWVKLYEKKSVVSSYKMEIATQVQIQDEARLNFVYKIYGRQQNLSDAI